MYRTQFRGRNYWRVSVCIALAAAGGCSNNSLPLVPVKGIVLIDNKPLTTGTLVTTIDDGRGARGVITSNGEFELETPGAGKGAIPGKHFVAVVAYEVRDPTNLESEQKPLVPNKYLSAYGSGLVIDVKEGMDEAVRLELDSRRARK